MEKNTEIWSCASRNWKTKLAISLACLVGYFLHVGFYPECPWWNHFAYSFSHANVFHLAVNMMVLWGIRNKMSALWAFIVAVAVSFLPMYVSDPTMGLSGFLFAVFGIMWGKTRRWLEASKKAMPFILITMLIPNVNGFLHLYAFIIGYFVGFLLNMFHKF